MVCLLIEWGILAYPFMIDLHVALNYGQGTGSAQLLRFVTEHTEVMPVFIGPGSF